MPLNKKGEKIMKAMQKEYGKKEGKQVFYASENKGNIEGVKKMNQGGMMNKMGGEAKRPYGAGAKRPMPMPAKPMGMAKGGMAAKKPAMAKGGMVKKGKR